MSISTSALPSANVSSSLGDSPLTRRSVLKALGAGAAFIAVSGVASAQRRSTPTSGDSGGAGGGGGGGDTSQPFKLPELPYAHDALAPHIDARTMEIHHTKHHQAYINAANKALEARPDLRELSGEQLLARLSAFDEPLRTTLRNQVGGHLNHSFFWPLLAAPTDYKSGRLHEALGKRFGSVDAFKEQFAQAAAKRFGSGWAWLVLQGDKLEVISTPNQDSPLMTGAQPIIGLDVWEHAYYLEYQNRRADYVKAFWAVLNWDQAEDNYRAAAS